MSNIPPELRDLTIATWQYDPIVTHVGGDNLDVDDTVLAYETEAVPDRRSYRITEESGVMDMPEGASLADRPEQFPVSEIAVTDQMTWRKPYLTNIAPGVPRLPVEAFFRVMGYRHGLSTYEDVLRLGVLGLVQEKGLPATEIAWLMRIVKYQTGQKVTIHGRANEPETPPAE